MPKIFLLQDLSKIFERFLAKQSIIQESGTIVRTDPEHLEGAFVFGELLEIFLGQDLFDFSLMGRIDQGDTGTFETSTREASAIDSGEGAHDLVDGNELRGTTLVVMDGGLARVEGQLSEEFQVTRLPCSHTLTNTTVLRVKVL